MASTPAAADAADRAAETTDARFRRRWLRRAAHRVQRIDIRDTWQVAAGAFLAVLGIVIILFAWYGAAHTAYVQQQIPYLVSGSFIGLGLMVLGGLLYWAHWLYRVYDQADLHNEAAIARQEELMGRLIDAIEAGAVAPRAGRAVAREGRRPVTVAAVEQLVVTAGGTNVHRADCAIVARHADGARRVSASAAATMAPCRICRPVLG
ncbi:MAG: hypothetical protein ACYDH6_04400 [Acidimicrobiales bacterium]